MINEVKYPVFPVYFVAKDEAGNIIHYGRTNPDQVTTTGLPIFYYDDTALEITGLPSERVDEILIDLASQNLGAQLIILEDAPRTTASDEAVNTLIDQGCTIITVQ